MHIEIEAKLKVDSPEEVAEKLAQVGAEFLEEQLQTDYYFDNKDRMMTKTDRCLRLRRLAAGESKRFFLTYKGAKERDDFKKRQEIAGGDSAEELLSALGYEKVLAFEKKRRIWRLGECEIALDDLPLLGSFVEIEGPDDGKIADVQRNLGLANLVHIPTSYASLMEEKLQELGKKQREVFFAKTRGCNYETR
jgi:adenylate cyclase class 2